MTRLLESHIRGPMPEFNRKRRQEILAAYNRDATADYLNKVIRGDYGWRH